MVTVAVKKVEEYRPELLDAAIAEQFAALGIEKDLKPGMKVLLKPNLLAARAPSMAITSHPQMLAAIARWLRAHGIEDITLADSPGGIYNETVLKKLYAACCMDELKDLVKLNYDLTSGTRNGFSLLTPVLEADYIIDCCKLKTHGLTVMTGAVKNLFGCIPGLKKPEWHCLRPTAETFAQMLIELCDTVKPSLVVMDAIDCMEGNGPGGGTVRHMGYLMASRSPYHIDETGARLMGLRPETVPMLREFRGKGKLEEPAELSGDELIPANPPFTLPDAVLGTEHFFTPNGIFHVFFGKKRSYPKVDPSKCVGCGRCAESCPKHIITFKNKVATMPRKGCISCFCCQEMCPVHAIGVYHRRFF